MRENWEEVLWKNNNKVILWVLFGNMSELKLIIFGLGYGLKDFLFGMIVLFRVSSILSDNFMEN